MYRGNLMAGTLAERREYGKAIAIAENKIFATIDNATKALDELRSRLK